MNPRYKVEDVKDYLDRLTENQVKLVARHCNRYRINPAMCAWYEDMADFFEDWCGHVGYTEKEARERFEEGKTTGEFKQFSDGSIVRFCV